MITSVVLGLTMGAMTLPNSVRCSFLCLFVAYTQSRASSTTAVTQMGTAMAAAFSRELRSPPRLAAAAEPSFPRIFQYCCFRSCGQQFMKAKTMRCHAARQGKRCMANACRGALSAFVGATAQSLTKARKEGSFRTASLRSSAQVASKVCVKRKHKNDTCCRLMREVILGKKHRIASRIEP